jgi:hypothetical protein
MSNLIDTDETWRKSSFSGGASGNCVEVSNRLRVRDTKDRAGGTLDFGAASLAAFTGAVKAGYFTR